MVKNVDVDVWVYSSNVPNARIWDTFGSRRVNDKVAPVVDLCKMTQRHHLGNKIKTVTAKDLVGLMNADEMKRSGIERGDEWGIEFNTMLRDGLLLRFLSEKGGIVIPDHSLVLDDFRHYYWSTTSNADLVMAGCPAGSRQCVDGGDFGDTTGSRSFVLLAAKPSKKLRNQADELVNKACMREFLGGSVFWGGLRSWFANVSPSNFNINILPGTKTGERDTMG